jgi:hypothetical protein
MYSDLEGDGERGRGGGGQEGGGAGRPPDPGLEVVSDARRVAPRPRRVLLWWFMVYGLCFRG